MRASAKPASSRQAFLNEEASLLNFGTNNFFLISTACIEHCIPSKTFCSWGAPRTDLFLRGNKSVPGRAAWRRLPVAPRRPSDLPRSSADRARPPPDHRPTNRDRPPTNRARPPPTTSADQHRRPPPPTTTADHRPPPTTACHHEGLHVT